jgi:photosystem II stability/assembly factor-like uncharacterized protein
MTLSEYAADVEQHLFNPAAVSGPTFTHRDPDALGYAFPPGAGWDSGDLTTDAGGTGWHTSVEELLDVMGCFRRQGSIMSPAAAQTMLDNGFGIDLIESTPLGTLYNKGGFWQSGAKQTEQSLAYFLPRDMELVVFANSPIGAAGTFFRDLVTGIYLNNITPEIWNLVITPQISNTFAILDGVAFPDTRHGWAEGFIEKDDGTRVGIVVATSDGGATWAKVHETTMTLRDIAFPDIHNGWAVGGDPPTILATADGGGTWKSQTSGIENDPGSFFAAVAFPDTQNGWVVGAVSNGGVILATANGGEKWSPQVEDAVNFAHDFRGVAFADTQHGWAVGAASPKGGLIVATSNGGETWERQTTPITNDKEGITDPLWGIAFADINHGWAVGDNGTILATADGGHTWTSKPSGTDARLFRVAFPDINVGWAVGQTTTGGGVILMTTDGGDTWTPQNQADPGQALLGVAFPDISHGWLVGGSGTILAVGLQPHGIVTGFRRTSSVLDGRQKRKKGRYTS